MTMKFNVKSALPSTALVLLSLMAVGKATKVYSASTGTQDTAEINTASFDADGTQFFEDEFSSGDTFCSGDSFGSGDSFCSGDSSGSGIPDGKAYGVFTVDRDTFQDNILFFPEISETLCVKKFNNVFIAQSPSDFLFPTFFGNETVIAKGKFKPRKDLLRIEYASDPNLGTEKTTDFRLTPIPGTNEWEGTWKSGKTTGDAIVRITFSESEYFANACDFYLGQ